MAPPDTLRMNRLRPGLRPALWIAITALFAFSPALGMEFSVTRQLVLIALLSLVVSGLNLTFGYAGEISFAQPAMYALGAYTTVIVAMRLGINDVAVVLVIASVAGLALGLIIGVPGLRLGGWVLAIASFFIILLISDIVSLASEWTGGLQGVSGIPLPQFLGFELGHQGYVALVVIVTSVWFACFRNFVVSRPGITLSVLRQSPILASSLGIPVYSTKLKAYAISGVPAAMAGALFAYLDGFVAPASFGVHLAISILAASILAGSRSVYGVFVGAALMQLGPMQTSAFGDYAFIAYGLFLMIAGVALRRGIAGPVSDLTRKLQTEIRRRRGRAGEVDHTSGAADAAGEFPPIAGQHLEVANVFKRFGGVAALTDVSFSAEPGEVIGLIGPNGSGKTSLLNIISGYYRPDHGEVRVGVKNVAGKPPHKIARVGVARTFQTPSIPEMSVRDAVRSARTDVARVSIIESMLRFGRHRKVARSDAEEAAQVLTRVGLGSASDEPAQALPLGTRRLLELARCLASEPSVLLLDEVASGLDDDEIEHLSHLVRAIRASGATVILVEHNFALVRALADQVVVLSRGELIVQDSPEVVAQHPDVLEQYLGERTLSSSDAPEVAHND